MHDQLNELFNRKMDRGDFLKHMGLGVLMIFGFGSLSKMLIGSTTSGRHVAMGNAKNALSSGYSGGVYGGNGNS